MNIRKGIYLVADPSMDENILLEKIGECLPEGIAAVQIWEKDPDQDLLPIAEKICSLCIPQNVPVIINNRWELLKDVQLSGVHFDQLPQNFEEIRKSFNRKFISGITCNNDLSDVVIAQKHKLDYISFCSIFPSGTANSCELVEFDTIQKARSIFSELIFIAGGITPHNLDKLTHLPFDGVAVISGILGTSNPVAAIREYKKHLNHIL
jgi:thiamine-phosphate pyrophosphorylase